MSGCKPDRYDLRTFVIATGKRDTAKYPHPSRFAYDLPLTISNVFGVSIRDYQFGSETLINENNRAIAISGVVGGTPFSKSVTLAVGAYGNAIGTLITALNAAMTSESVPAVFSLVALSDRVRLALGSGTSAGDYIFLSGTNSLLRILGFGGTVLVYNTTAPAGVTGAFTGTLAGGGVTAASRYDVNNLSEMVVRIDELEALLSNDAVTNRSTSILFNGNSANYTVRQAQDHYIPLLQKQQRVQRLHIQLLNMEGDLYDTVNNEAVFILEVYCETNLSS